jgi:oligopeptide transport system ATP-binding protein
VVAGVCDRIAVMYAGYIVEEAPAEELFADPRHPYTLGLLRSLPRIDQPRRERLIPIEGMPPDLINLPRGCPFAPRCTYAVDRSEEELPVLEPVGPRHRVACWVDVRAEESNGHGA